MSGTKEYTALQEECERLRAENQRLNKDLARYRAKYGELSELDKGGEIGALSAVEIKSGESKVHAPSSNVVLVTNQSPSENAKVHSQNQKFYKTFTFFALPILLNHPNTQVFCVLKNFFEIFSDSIIAEPEKEC